jgi:hypothetical protein
MMPAFCAGAFGGGMQQLPQLAGFGQVPGNFPAHDAAAAAAAQNLGWVWGMAGGPQGPGAVGGLVPFQHPQQQHFQMPGLPHLGMPHAGERPLAHEVTPKLLLVLYWHRKEVCADALW